MSKNNEEERRYLCTELNNNRRHYSTLRFAVFSVYFAVIGGLASIAFGIVTINAGGRINVSLWSKWGCLLVTLVFFWFEILGTLNLRHFIEVAERMPTRYRIVTKRKKYRGLKGHYATWSLFVLLILFWIYVIIRDT